MAWTGSTIGIDGYDAIVAQEYLQNSEMPSLRLVDVLIVTHDNQLTTSLSSKLRQLIAFDIEVSRSTDELDALQRIEDEHFDVIFVDCELSWAAQNVLLNAFDQSVLHTNPILVSSDNANAPTLSSDVAGKAIPMLSHEASKDEIEQILSASLSRTIWI